MAVVSPEKNTLWIMATPKRLLYLRTCTVSCWSRDGRDPRGRA